MKKISVVFKEVSASRIKNNLKSSDGIFVINYLKLSSPDMSALRQSLRDSKARLFVVKNTVARRVLKDSGLEAIVNTVDGPCGLVFAKEEPVSVSKALCDFLKTHEQLKLQGGFLQEKVLTKNDIEALAKLPSKDVLRAQVVGALNAPIFGFVNVLSQTLKKLVYCLEQIKQTKKS